MDDEELTYEEAVQAEEEAGKALEKAREAFWAAVKAYDQAKHNRRLAAIAEQKKRGC